VLAAGRWTPSDGVAAIPAGALPLVIARAHGCRSVDSAGREYVDYVMGWGSALLGFAHPAVRDAIHRQLELGFAPTLLSEVEIELAEDFVAMIPCAEQVAFGKNGSDVLALAVRLARAYTRREKVLFCGYHGIQDWYMAADPDCPGIPRSLRELILPFRYNDLDALARLFERNPGQVAAVVMEPATEQLPAPGFLEGVKACSERHGAVLVFDEVITGLRLAPGGAQEYFGVRPHLACFAKCLANGLPLSVLAGPRGLDALVSGARYGLTFRGEALSLAAARATLRVCREEPVARHVWSVGESLRRGIHEQGVRKGVPVSLAGPGPRVSFHFESLPGLSEHLQLSLFVQECLVRGVLHNGHLLPSYAHGARDVEQTLDVFEQALDAVALARLRGSADGLLHLRPIQGFQDIWSLRMKTYEDEQQAAGAADG
jgi:glutamate-1-semialdehyde aminotransferase